MRKCRALVKCSRGCSYVSSILDTSTLLLLLHIIFTEYQKRTLAKHVVWEFGLRRTALEIARMFDAESFLSYRTLVFAEHKKNNWLDVCAAGWHQQTRVRTTICFEILRLATFDLPSCKTLIFDSSKQNNIS